MKYYYLITSLPELAINAEKLPVQRDEFEERAFETLSPDDIELFEILKLNRIDCIKQKDKNIFLKKYFTFEQILRDFITGINMKKLQRAFFDRIVGSDDFITDSIRHSNLPDFGLGKELPFAVKIIEFIEAQKYLDLEQYLDYLRFETIDELNRFNYFSIEQVLGYSLKLEILERWSFLTEGRGKEKLEKLSNKDIGRKDTYQFIDRRHN